MNYIMQDGKKLDDPMNTYDGVEIGPVDVQISGTRIGVTSVDGSLKIFDLEGGLVVDSNRIEQASSDVKFSDPT